MHNEPITNSSPQSYKHFWEFISSEISQSFPPFLTRDEPSFILHRTAYRINNYTKSYIDDDDIRCYNLLINICRSLGADEDIAHTHYRRPCMTLRHVLPTDDDKKMLFALLSCVQHILQNRNGITSDIIASESLEEAINSLTRKYGIPPVHAKTIVQFGLLSRFFRDSKTEFVAAIDTEIHQLRRLAMNKRQSDAENLASQLIDRITRHLKTSPCDVGGYRSLGSCFTILGILSQTEDRDASLVHFRAAFDAATACFRNTARIATLPDVAFAANKLGDEYVEYDNEYKPDESYLLSYNIYRFMDDSLESPAELTEYVGNLEDKLKECGCEINGLSTEEAVSSAPKEIVDRAMDISSLGAGGTQELRNLQPTFESISNYIKRHHTDFPDPRKDIDANTIELMFIELFLDEQIVILKGIIKNNPTAKRALKLLGLRYFWSLNNRFVDPALKCLTKYIELAQSSDHSAIYEIIGGLYLLNDDPITATIYFKMSARLDIPFVLQMYGSLKAYSDLQRQDKCGSRFKDYSSGNYTIQELLL